ncbi:MAG: acetylglutamate kinase, partial [Dehalococcoidia bacterium]
MNGEPMKIIVVKIGGSTLSGQDTTLEDLVTLQKGGVIPVVVHGGGQAISDWLSRMGIATQFKKGLRVTDAQSLEVVMAVLAGLINKELVAEIGHLGGKALGLSGLDGQLIQARVHDPKLGYVGEIEKVNLEPLQAILGAGYIPVIAPLASLSGMETAGSPKKALNVNADTAAGEIAAALGGEKLIFLTDVPGISDGEGGLIPHLSPEEARGLISSGVASGGMIPK